MMSVLLPECLIRIIADIHKVPFKEVRLRIVKYELNILCVGVCSCVTG